MILLMCGGRDYQNRRSVKHWLDRLRPTVVIHGGATGADTLADEEARKLGIPVWDFPAAWKVHGNAAEPVRNRAMLECGRPDLVIAFPGGAGTADCVRQAKAMGIEVKLSD